MPAWQISKIFMVNGLINTLVAFLIGGATLSFNFKAVDTSGNIVYQGDGDIVTLGNNYRMETRDILVVSDGSVKGIYQKGADEIVLMSVEEGGDILDNPFVILLDKDANYKISAADADAQGIPHTIVLKAGGGAEYTIKIMKYSALQSADTSLFNLNPANYPNAVVTDLR